MKRVALTIISGFLLLQVAYPQTSINTQAKPILTSADTTKLMNHIDSIVQEIKGNQNGYEEKLMVEDSTGHSYEYVNHNELKEIKLDCKDPRDNKYKKVDWYFENGKEVYSESVWMDASGKVVNTDKVYVYNEQLIVWFNANKRVSNQSPSFKELIPKVSSYAVALTAEANDVEKGLQTNRSSNGQLNQLKPKESK